MEDIQEEIATIDKFATDHIYNKFESVDEELMKIEEVKRSLETISRKLEELEEILNDKKDPDT